MNDIYNDQTYLKHNPTWGEEDAPMKAEAIAGLLVKNNISFKTLAEAGCGSGEILVQLQKEFPGTENYMDLMFPKMHYRLRTKSRRIRSGLSYWISPAATGLTFILIFSW